MSWRLTTNQACSKYLFIMSVRTIDDPSTAAGDRVATTFTGLLQQPIPVAAIVSRSNRDYATDVNQSFIAGYAAGTKKVVEDSGRCYKAGYDHGIKQFQERLKDIGLPNTVEEAQTLKRKSKLLC